MSTSSDFHKEGLFSSAARLDSSSDSSILLKSNGISSYPTTTLLKSTQPTSNGSAKHLHTTNNNGYIKLPNGTGTPNGINGITKLKPVVTTNKSNGLVPQGPVTFGDAKFLNGTGLRRKSISSLSRISRPSPASTDPGISLFTTQTVLGVLLSSVSVVMAAIGITNGEDWLAFLVISSQLGAIFLCLFAIYHYRAFYIVYKTILRDIKGGYRYAKILISVSRAQWNNATVHTIFAANVKRNPNKVCFYFENEVWTFKQVDEYSNQIGNYFTKQGLTKGDSVSLFMENRPQYVCLWLGLCKIGVVPALINFNLRLQALKHSVEVSKSKALIYGHELSDAVTEILDMGGMDSLPLYCSGQGDSPFLRNSINLDSGLHHAPISIPIPSEPINFTDKLLYIFTSGTTGLPKAAVIKHSRYIMATTGSHVMFSLRGSDIVYAPFPLYHTVGIALGVGQSFLFNCTVVLRRKFSATNYWMDCRRFNVTGGMLGVGQALIHGSTAVLRRKFSAKSYWEDCARYNCTAAQYIGEICRYLLSQPPALGDTKHKVRLMFGNGLRPQIWTEFATRFNIKTISEFYGATEGNCNIVNIDNHVGAVGFISRIMPFIYPVTLIKVDEVTGEPIRDPRTGLVIRCRPNEDGELVGRIVDNHPVREFQGYADSTATNKKIVKHVFKKGDSAFRTGDMLLMDEFGYFYFKDRTGDTYRWKGENVSTSEVEAVVSTACHLRDAVVYGVEIPGSEGRAGMAAIMDSDESLDFQDFTDKISKSLPAYARPVLVRIVKELDMTGTYKMKKVELQKEGYDVTRVSDKIYVLTNGKYVLLDNELYSKLCSGTLRL